LDLLTLKEDGDIPSRTRRRSSIFLGRDDATRSHLSPLGAQAIADNHRGTFPFTIVHEGSLGGSYTLHAETEESRLTWRSKLEEVIRLRESSSKVFKMKILNRESFLMKTGVSSGYLPQGRQLSRTINCITPFSASHTVRALSFLTNPKPATRDGRDLVAIGCVEGLWIGKMSDSQCWCSIHVQSFQFGVTSYSFPPHSPPSNDTTVYRTRRIRNHPDTN
jgi:hypothetical protein